MPRRRTVLDADLAECFCGVIADAVVVAHPLAPILLVLELLWIDFLDPFRFKGSGRSSARATRRDVPAALWIRAEETGRFGCRV